MESNAGETRRHIRAIGNGFGNCWTDSDNVTVRPEGQCSVSQQCHFLQLNKHMPKTGGASEVPEARYYTLGNREMPRV